MPEDLEHGVMVFLNVEFNVPVLLSLLVSFATAWSGTLLIRTAARRWRIMDVPNRRSAHSNPTPTLGGVAIAYPYSLLSEVGVINDTLGDQRLVVFWKGGTASALYKQRIAESKDVGSAAAFSRVLDGRELTFAAFGDGYVDRQTASSWNLFGYATAGPLAGRQLTPLASNEFLWFAWAEFRPDTLLYSP